MDVAAVGEKQEESARRLLSLHEDHAAGRRRPEIHRRAWQLSPLRRRIARSELAEIPYPETTLTGEIVASRVLYVVDGRSIVYALFVKPGAVSGAFRR